MADQVASETVVISGSILDGLLKQSSHLPTDPILLSTYESVNHGHTVRMADMAASIAHVDPWIGQGGSLKLSIYTHSWRNAVLMQKRQDSPRKGKKKQVYQP